MLVLTRKLNESIVLTLPDGAQITVQLTGLGSGRAQLGINAPSDVVIQRE